MKTVLVVEDSEDDVFFLKRSCDASGITLRLEIAVTGKAAVDYLSGTGEYANHFRFPRPHLVLLDVNLPLLNGHEVLEWIRRQADYKLLPVVMLTSSIHPTDVTRAYSLGVTSYVRKNPNRKEFTEGIQTLLKYWLGTNVPPT